MRYPPGQKQRTRKRVLDVSASLAKKKGFAAVSVDDLMTGAGLTGGAFYAHFRSKDALFAELVTRELAHTADMLSPCDGQSEGEWLTRLLDLYLTDAHVRSPGTGCVIPALGAEIARADPKVRAAFEKAMLALQQTWAERLGDSDLAWSTICQLVGAVLVARAMKSTSMVDEVVQANRAHIARATRARAPSAPRASRDHGSNRPGLK